MQAVVDQCGVPGGHVQLRQVLPVSSTGNRLDRLSSQVSQMPAVGPGDTLMQPPDTSRLCRQYAIYNDNRLELC